MAFDGVHSLPEGPTFGVRCEPMRAEGVFDPDEPTFGVRLNDLVTYPAMTMIHEAGHALDYYYIGKGDGWMSKHPNPPKLWAEWTEIVEDSASNRQLVQNTTTSPLPSIQETCLYFLRPEEVFARCYAQYIALCSQHQGLLEELKHMQLEFPSAQWQDAEFPVIAESFERLLEAFGIKRLRKEAK